MTKTAGIGRNGSPGNANRSMISVTLWFTLRLQYRMKPTLKITLVTYEDVSTLPRIDHFVIQHLQEMIPAADMSSLMDRFVAVTEATVIRMLLLCPGHPVQEACQSKHFFITPSLSCWCIYFYHAQVSSGVVWD